MLWGDRNAPGTMIEAIADICKDDVYKCIVFNINNIIIYARTYEEHVRVLKKALQELEEQQCSLIESKYQVFIKKL